MTLTICKSFISYNDLPDICRVYDVGKTSLMEYVVGTGDAKPIKDRTRPLNPVIQQHVKHHIDEQVKAGILAPGNGP